MTTDDLYKTNNEEKLLNTTKDDEKQLQIATYYYG